MRDFGGATAGAVVAFCVFGFVSSGAARAETYDVTLLGSLGGNTYTTAINNRRCGLCFGGSVPVIARLRNN